MYFLGFDLGIIVNIISLSHRSAMGGNLIHLPEILGNLGRPRKLGHYN